jgi:hypothetical protein
LPTKQIPSGDNQSLVLWARILYYLIGGYRERIEYENLGIKGLRNLGIDFKEKVVVER